MRFNLNNKKFKPLTNSDNGEVAETTIFHYFQEENIIWAEYSGGGILKGYLVGKMVDRELIFNYQHINQDFEIMTGKCQSQLLINESDKIQLFEKWEWTCRDFSKGESTLMEF